MSSIARKYSNKNYVEHLFKNNIEGYIQVIQLKNKKIIYLKNHKGKEIINDIKDYKDAIDTFISINPSFNGKREGDCIRQLRALYIDLDYKKFTLNDIIQDVWSLAIQGEIPTPSMLVSSGRGAHIYWRIEDAPSQALATWQELEDFLYSKLKHLGADKKATDATRVLRLPDTINSRNNTKCEVVFIDNEIIHSMYELREKYLKWKPKVFKEIKVKEEKKEFKVLQFFTSYSLHITRAEDILTLCEARKFNVTGYRNKILHMYAYWIGVTIRDDEKLKQLVNKLNNKFTKPLKQSEVNAILRCVPKAIDKFIAYEQGLRDGKVKRVSKGMRDKGGYWYKNETIIEMLDITIEEQRLLKTIISTQVKYERRRVKDNETKKANRRNKAGLTAKQQELSDLRIKVLELRAQGLSLRAVAKELNISLGKVQRCIK